MIDNISVFGLYSGDAKKDFPVATKITDEQLDYIEKTVNYYFDQTNRGA